MADDFSTFSRNPSGPYERAVAVTPSDAADLTNIASALYIGGAGAVKIDTVGGDTVTFSGMLVGTVYPIRIKKVYSTGTTATNIVALR